MDFLNMPGVLVSVREQYITSRTAQLLSSLHAQSSRDKSPPLQSPLENSAIPPEMKTFLGTYDDEDVIPRTVPPLLDSNGDGASVLSQPQQRDNDGIPAHDNEVSIENRLFVEPSIGGSHGTVVQDSIKLYKIMH